MDRQQGERRGDDGPCPGLAAPSHKCVLSKCAGWFSNPRPRRSWLQFRTLSRGACSGRDLRRASSASAILAQASQSTSRRRRLRSSSARTSEGLRSLSCLRMSCITEPPHDPDVELEKVASDVKSLRTDKRELRWCCLVRVMFFWDRSTGSLTGRNTTGTLAAAECA